MMRLIPACLALAAVTAFQTPHPYVVVVGPARRINSLPFRVVDNNDEARRSTSSSTTLFGIPKMFRWLTDQYPNILNKRLNSGNAIPPIDNFYLDMNGIIHPCTHGNNEDEITLLDETEMFKKIFGYVDRLYKIVKPRKVLYLAVDGVAPRAKMNQQRSRRFRSSKEAEKLAATILARDGALPDRDAFDSNCITPGTDFMLKLGLAMRKWIQYKQETDPVWKNGCDVVVSGPDVPGEGEHKVMDYIRETKALYDFENPTSSLQHPHWSPGLTHVLYGLDADLIMLGLATHEPNFLLLREKMSVVMAGRGRHKHRKKKDMLEYTRDDFELLELSALREMFQIQFRKFADAGRLNVTYDVQRVIDDFIFMCMFVGNDFLPHVPHLEIDNGALSLMLNNYVDLLADWGGYLTDKEKIHPARLENFLYNLAVFEEEHFRRRAYEENEPGWGLGTENEHEEDDMYGGWYGDTPTPLVAKEANTKMVVHTNVFPLNGEESVNAIKSDVEKSVKKLHPREASRSYREFYYQSKLGISPLPTRRDEAQRDRRAIARDYIEGLHWNLNYYHNGCCSWNWYFPHLYAPLATDIVNLWEFYGDVDIDIKDNNGFRAFPFDQTEPFPPLAQLLSVLPPQSATLLPPVLGELMTEPSSPLAPYYPSDFDSDANGKRQTWEAIVKIPFINGDQLLEVVNKILEADESKELLSNSERRRNLKGQSHTFVPERDPDYVAPSSKDRVNGESATRRIPNSRATGSSTARRAVE
jgi:5'-3' exoribonuclease 1